MLIQATRNDASDPKMRIGLLLGGLFTSADNMVRIAKQAEEGGVDYLYVPDSQLIYRSCYMTLGLIARQTKTIRLGSCVSPISTRDPSVLANEAMTLAELSSGRALLGLGVGDSGVLRVGRNRATLRELQERVRIIKGILQKEETEYGNLGIRWAPEDLKIPIFLAGTGPKTLALAGAIGDGALILAGAFPEGIQYAITKIRDGAREAGREPAEVKLAPVVYLYASKDSPTAFELGKPDAVWFYRNAPHIIRLAGGTPVDMTAMSYEKFDYVHSSDRSVAEKAPPFVEENVARRLIIAGTPEDAIRRIKELERLGIDHIVIRHTENEDGWNNFLTLFLKEIVPALKD